MTELWVSPIPIKGGMPEVVDIDPYNLRSLSRPERQTFKKRYKGDIVSDPRKTNLLAEIEELGADGTVIKNDKGEVPTVKFMIDWAFRTAHQADQRMDLKQKQKNYLILKRIKEANEIAFTDEERENIKQRIAAMFLQVQLVGKFMEVFDGEPAAA